MQTIEKMGMGSQNLGVVASEALVGAVDLYEKEKRKGKDRVGQEWWTNPNVDDAIIE